MGFIYFGGFMKIKYLKDAPAGKKGDVKDVKDYEGRVLIKLGFAILHDKTPLPTKRECQKIKEEKIGKNILLNINGSPVVDDFGSNVNTPKVKSGSK